LKKLKVLIIGIGDIGLRIADIILDRKKFEIVGVLEKDRNKIGKDLGLFLKRKDIGITITESLNDLVSKNKPDVAILSTVSDIENIYESVKEVLKYKINIITTCEELSYPWIDSPNISNEINKLAIDKNVAVIGTGINPGFIMDSYPTFLTAVCSKVNNIKVSRIQDASLRRTQFKKKIGVGLELEEFLEKVENKKIRHVGLKESVYMIASRMYWDLNNYKEIITPVIANENIIDKDFQIKVGQVIGVQQIGIGLKDQKEKIILLFKASLGELNPIDKIEIKGDPNIVSEIKGGINGDIATAAITVNTAEQINKAKPGLRTMVDIPLVSYFI